MKTRVHSFMIVAVAILFSIFFAGASFAAGEKTMNSSGHEKSAMSSPSGSYFRVSNWMDKTVKSTDGHDLGTVKDIVFGHKGRAEYVVISHQDKLIPVPYRAGDFSVKGDNVIANLNKSKLDNAPSFTEGHWPNFASSNYDQKVNSYYGAGYEKSSQEMKSAPKNGPMGTVGTGASK